MKMRVVCGILVMACGAAMGAGPATMPAATCPATGTADCCDPAVLGADTQAATMPGMVMLMDGAIEGSRPVLFLADMPATAPAPVTEAVSQALKAMQDVDGKLESFTADATKVDTDPRSGDKETRVGSVYYKKAKEGVSLAFQIDNLTATGVRAVAKDETYAYVPPYYVHWDRTGKVMERTLLVKPGSSVDPLKVGSGLLPLPIGQDPAAMTKEFDITEVPLKAATKLPEGTAAADVIVLKLSPRKKGVYDFTDVTLTVDKKLNLPVIIEQTKVDHGMSMLTLNKLVENKPLKADSAKEFDVTPPTGTDWKVTDTK